MLRCVLEGPAAWAWLPLRVDLVTGPAGFGGETGVLFLLLERGILHVTF